MVASKKLKPPALKLQCITVRDSTVDTHHIIKWSIVSLDVLGIFVRFTSVTLDLLGNFFRLHLSCGTGWVTNALGSPYFRAAGRLALEFTSWTQWKPLSRYRHSTVQALIADSTVKYSTVPPPASSTNSWPPLNCPTTGYFRYLLITCLYPGSKVTHLRAWFF